jgi:hypothetical protein
MEVKVHVGWYTLVWYVDTNVSEEQAASIFRI